MLAAALCWLILSGLVAVVAGTESPQRDFVTTASYDSAPGVTLFFDYADDDQNKSAEISKIIGEPPVTETNVRTAHILRAMLLCSALVLIVFILYHIFCRLYCAYGV